MNFSITTGGLQVKSWLAPEKIDKLAMAQIEKLASVPYAFSHIAIMPDVHPGIGMPIGGVLAADNAVVPNAVGVDIGCGMRAVATKIKAEEIMPEREKILNGIQRSVPTGFRHHKEKHFHKVFDNAPSSPIVQKELESAYFQIGTLGGGNHFIELQKDQNDDIWVMLHSGSRHFGRMICDYYNKLARDKRYYDLPEETFLAALPLDSAEGQEYFEAMKFACDFARANREMMMQCVLDEISRRLPLSSDLEATDIHHNYANEEEHFGRRVIVHRKGAVRAEGTVIIPGSMGTASYIGEGLLNAASFYSCSHGAGRVLSRSQAKKEISVEKVILEMRAKNITFYAGSKTDAAEEASAAYKDIESVIEAQKDLFKPLYKLSAIGVLKG